MGQPKPQFPSKVEPGSELDVSSNRQFFLVVEGRRRRWSFATLFKFGRFGIKDGEDEGTETLRVVFHGDGVLTKPTSKYAFDIEL